MEIANARLPVRSLEKKRGVSRRLLWSTLQAYLFLLPTFALIGLFSYYPAVLALYHSLTDWNGVLIAKYVGLNNFREMVRDQVLLASLSNMLTVVLWSLIITLTVPLLVAELIYSLRSHRAQYWYRLLFVAPIVVPFVVTLLVWRFIYDPDLGLLNALLDRLGIAYQSRWLGDPNLALYCLLFIGFPFAAGTNVLIYLAGLQGIGESVIDAAKLDGAVGLRRIISIDLPLIMGQVRLLGILSLIGGIQGFGAQLVLTRGGPGYATMVPGMWMYETAFSYSRMGYASAIGTSMFIVILGLTLVIMRSVESSTEYTPK
jgi:raffinose/stachyose/melibiose transport system permease protein